MILNILFYILLFILALLIGMAIYNFIKFEPKNDDEELKLILAEIKLSTVI